MKYHVPCHPGRTSALQGDAKTVRRDANLAPGVAVYPDVSDAARHATSMPKPGKSLTPTGETPVTSVPAPRKGECRDGRTEGRANSRRWHPVASRARRKPLRVRPPLLPLQQD